MLPHASGPSPKSTGRRARSPCAHQKSVRRSSTIQPTTRNTDRQKIHGGTRVVCVFCSARRELDTTGGEGQVRLCAPQAVPMAWSAREARGHFSKIKHSKRVRKLNTVNECESKVHRVCRVVRGFRVTGKGVADCEVSLMHRCRYSRWRTRTVVPSHLVYDNQHHRRRLRMPTLGSLLLRGELMAPCAIHHRAITRITR